MNVRCSPGTQHFIICQTFSDFLPQLLPNVLLDSTELMVRLHCESVYLSQPVQTCPEPLMADPVCPVLDLSSKIDYDMGGQHWALLLSCNSMQLIIVFLFLYWISSRNVWENQRIIAKQNNYWWLVSKKGRSLVQNKEFAYRLLLGLTTSIQIRVFQEQK